MVRLFRTGEFTRSLPGELAFGGLGSRDDAFVKATKLSYEILLYAHQIMTRREYERGRDAVSGTLNVSDMHPCTARITLVPVRLPSSCSRS